MSPTEQENFIARCTAAAGAARAAGVSYAKVPGQCAIAVSGNGGAASVFPIVTDLRTWRETSPEEAFFVVLGDVYAWAAARVDDAKLSRLGHDSATLGELRRESDEQLANLRALAAHAGGLAGLKSLWAAAGLAAAAVEGLTLPSTSSG